MGSQKRRFLFIGGPADGRRIELPSAIDGTMATGLVGADGKPVFTSWPGAWAVPAENDGDAFTTYRPQRVTACEDNGDVVQWTVYVDEALELGADLAMRVLIDEWGVL